MACSFSEPPGAIFHDDGLNTRSLVLIEPASLSRYYICFIGVFNESAGNSEFAPGFGDKFWSFSIVVLAFMVYTVTVQQVDGDSTENSDFPRYPLDRRVIPSRDKPPKISQ